MSNVPSLSEMHNKSNRLKVYPMHVLKTNRAFKLLLFLTSKQVRIYFDTLTERIQNSRFKSVIH